MSVLAHEFHCKMYFFRLPIIRSQQDYFHFKNNPKNQTKALGYNAGVISEAQSKLQTSNQLIWPEMLHPVKLLHNKLPKDWGAVEM